MSYPYEDMRKKDRGAMFEVENPYSQASDMMAQAAGTAAQRQPDKTEEIEPPGPTAGGAITSGMSGAAAGAMVGGPYGAAAGAILGIAAYYLM